MQFAVREAKGVQLFDAEEWCNFAQKLIYFACDLKDPDSYTGLAVRIQALNGGALGNRLYYCAMPPTLVGPIIDGIGQAGLTNESSGWARIAIEKPFGRDLASAQALSDYVAGVFLEHQVYRIDHYLGKETVRTYWFSALATRFSNRYGTVIISLTCAFPKPTKPCCWMRCAVMPPCLPAGTVLKRNGD
jgi:glucose-6-phosphate 1-dehydrogenase